MEKNEGYTPKPGDFIRFKGVSGAIITGMFCREKEGYIDYVRDSMTPWSASAGLVLAKAEPITEADFIRMVEYNAYRSGCIPPESKHVASVLKMFTEDFDKASKDMEKIKVFLKGNLGDALSEQTRQD